jgi:hypothetical protein
LDMNAARVPRSFVLDVGDSSGAGMCKIKSLLMPGRRFEL